MDLANHGTGQNKITWAMLLRIVIKAALLFVILNLAYAALNPLPALGRISVYNTLIPGRARFPFGDNPDRSYSLSILQPEALLASHEIQAARLATDEFRIILVGDSSVWGYLQTADQTLAAEINRAQWTLPDGRRVRAFNFGYPTLAVSKDLLFLERALAYEPDMIVWFVTLESMPWSTQLDAPLLQYNPELTRELIDRYDLQMEPDDARIVDVNWFGRTIIGQRRELADWLRLQLYGVLWAGSHIDHEIPETYEPRMEDLENDPTFHGYGPGELQINDLAYEAISAGIEAAGEVPVLLVNEPIFISTGANSDVRYNFYYPRWAYDQYRQELDRLAVERGWHYVDIWDLLQGALFTDSAIHYTPEGVKRVIENLQPVLLELAANSHQ